MHLRKKKEKSEENKRSAEPLLCLVTVPFKERNYKWHPKEGKRAPEWRQPDCMNSSPSQHTTSLQQALYKSSVLKPASLYKLGSMELTNRYLSCGILLWNHTCVTNPSFHYTVPQRSSVQPLLATNNSLWFMLYGLCIFTMVRDKKITVTNIFRCFFA